MKIVHIMSDGSVRDSVEGLTVSYEKNKGLYQIIDSIHNGDKRYEKDFRNSNAS